MKKDREGEIRQNGGGELAFTNWEVLLDSSGHEYLECGWLHSLLCVCIVRTHQSTHASGCRSVASLLFAAYFSF